MATKRDSGQRAFDFSFPLPSGGGQGEGADRAISQRLPEPAPVAPTHIPEIVRAPAPAADPATESGLREARLRDLAERLAITRPLAFLDLETTGTSPERDRILEIAVLMVSPGGRITRFSSLVNPGIPIPPEATAVHGISQEEVADKPAFGEIAGQLARDLASCDLVGFNLRRFDLRMLSAEFARASVWFNPEEARVVDAMSIFHAMEKRDLESAVRFYCGRRHHGHRAEEDVLATVDVLHAQVARYEELPRDVVGLDDFCRPKHPDWLTPDGRIVWKEGAARIAFGKHNGKSLKDLAKEAPDYLRWLIDKDFPEEVKKIAENALQGTFPAAPPPPPPKKS